MTMATHAQRGADLVFDDGGATRAVLKNSAPAKMVVRLQEE